MPDDIHNPAFKKPFKYGWRRELVYRSKVAPQRQKIKADVYYYTPLGKKLRSKKEIKPYLTPGLSVENFSFVGEAIGVPSVETVRQAKTFDSTKAAVKKASSPQQVHVGDNPPVKKVPRKTLPPQRFLADEYIYDERTPMKKHRPPRSSFDNKNGEIPLKKTPKSPKFVKVTSLAAKRPIHSNNKPPRAAKKPRICKHLICSKRRPSIGGDGKKTCLIEQRSRLIQQRSRQIQQRSQLIEQRLIHYEHMKELFYDERREIVANDHSYAMKAVPSSSIIVKNDVHELPPATNILPSNYEELCGSELSTDIGNDNTAVTLPSVTPMTSANEGNLVTTLQQQTYSEADNISYLDLIQTDASQSINFQNNVVESNLSQPDLFTIYSTQSDSAQPFPSQSDITQTLCMQPDVTEPLPEYPETGQSLPVQPCNSLLLPPLDPPKRLPIIRVVPLYRLQNPPVQPSLEENQPDSTGLINTFLFKSNEAHSSDPSLSNTFDHIPVESNILQSVPSHSVEPSSIQPSIVKPEEKRNSDPNQTKLITPQQMLKNAANSTAVNNGAISPFLKDTGTYTAELNEANFTLLKDTGTSTAELNAASSSTTQSFPTQPERAYENSKPIETQTLQSLSIYPLKSQSSQSSSTVQYSAAETVISATQSSTNQSQMVHISSASSLKVSDKVEPLHLKKILSSPPQPIMVQWSPGQPQSVQTHPCSTQTGEVSIVKPSPLQPQVIQHSIYHSLATHSSPNQSQGIHLSNVSSKKVKSDKKPPSSVQPMDKVQSTVNVQKPPVELENVQQCPVELENAQKLHIHDHSLKQSADQAPQKVQPSPPSLLCVQNVLPFPSQTPENVSSPAEPPLLKVQLSAGKSAQKGQPIVPEKVQPSLVLSQDVLTSPIQTLKTVQFPINQCLKKVQYFPMQPSGKAPIQPPHKIQPAAEQSLKSVQPFLIQPPEEVTAPVQLSHLHKMVLPFPAENVPSPKAIPSDVKSVKQIQPCPVILQKVPLSRVPPQVIHNSLKYFKKVQPSADQSHEKVQPCIVQPPKKVTSSPFQPIQEAQSSVAQSQNKLQPSEIVTSSIQPHQKVQQSAKKSAQKVLPSPIICQRIQSILIEPPKKVTSSPVHPPQKLQPSCVQSFKKVQSTGKVGSSAIQASQKVQLSTDQTFKKVQPLPIQPTEKVISLNQPPQKVQPTEKVTSSPTQPSEKVQTSLPQAKNIQLSPLYSLSKQDPHIVNSSPTPPTAQSRPLPKQSNPLSSNLSQSFKRPHPAPLSFKVADITPLCSIQPNSSYSYRLIEPAERAQSINQPHHVESDSGKSSTSINLSFPVQSSSVNSKIIQIHPSKPSPGQPSDKANPNHPVPIKSHAGLPPTVLRSSLRTIPVARSLPVKSLIKNLAQFQSSQTSVNTPSVQSQSETTQFSSVKGPFVSSPPFTANTAHTGTVQVSSVTTNPPAQSSIRTLLSAKILPAQPLSSNCSPTLNKPALSKTVQTSIQSSAALPPPVLQSEDKTNVLQPHQSQTQVKISPVQSHIVQSRSDMLVKQRSPIKIITVPQNILKSRLLNVNNEGSTTPNVKEKGNEHLKTFHEVNKQKVPVLLPYNSSKANSTVHINYTPKTNGMPNTSNRVGGAVSKFQLNGKHHVSLTVQDKKDGNDTYPPRQISVPCLTDCKAVKGKSCDLKCCVCSHEFHIKCVIPKGLDLTKYSTEVFTLKDQPYICKECAQKKQENQVPKMNKTKTKNRESVPKKLYENPPKCIPIHQKKISSVWSVDENASVSQICSNKQSLSSSEESLFKKPLPPSTCETRKKRKKSSSESKSPAPKIDDCQINSSDIVFTLKTKPSLSSRKAVIRIPAKYKKSLEETSASQCQPKILQYFDQPGTSKQYYIPTETPHTFTRHTFTVSEVSSVLQQVIGGMRKDINSSQMQANSSKQDDIMSSSGLPKGQKSPPAKYKSQKPNLSKLEKTKLLDAIKQKFSADLKLSEEQNSSTKNVDLIKTQKPSLSQSKKTELLDAIKLSLSPDLKLSEEHSSSSARIKDRAIKSQKPMLSKSEKTELLDAIKLSFSSDLILSKELNSPTARNKVPIKSQNPNLSILPEKQSSQGVPYRVNKRPNKYQLSKSEKSDLIDAIISTLSLHGWENPYKKKETKEPKKERKESNKEGKESKKGPRKPVVLPPDNSFEKFCSTVYEICTSALWKMFILLHQREVPLPRMAQILKEMGIQVIKEIVPIVPSEANLSRLLDWIINRAITEVMRLPESKHPFVTEIHKGVLRITRSPRFYINTIFSCLKHWPYYLPTYDTHFKDDVRHNMSGLIMRRVQVSCTNLPFDDELSNKDTRANNTKQVEDSGLTRFPYLNLNYDELSNDDTRANNSEQVEVPNLVEETANEDLSADVLKWITTTGKSVSRNIQVVQLTMLKLLAHKLATLMGFYGQEKSIDSILGDMIINWHEVVEVMGAIHDLFKTAKYVISSLSDTVHEGCLASSKSKAQSSGDNTEAKSSNDNTEAQSSSHNTKAQSSSHNTKAQSSNDNTKAQSSSDNTEADNMTRKVKINGIQYLISYTKGGVPIGYTAADNLFSEMEADSSSDNSNAVFHIIKQYTIRMFNDYVKAFIDLMMADFGNYISSDNTIIFEQFLYKAVNCDIRDGPNIPTWLRAILATSDSYAKVLGYDRPCNLKSYDATRDNQTVWTNVFKHLNVPDLLRARQVCQSWRCFADSEELWLKVKLENIRIVDWIKFMDFFSIRGTQVLHLHKLIEGESDIDKMIDWCGLVHALWGMKYLREVIVGFCPPIILFMILMQSYKLTSIGSTCLVAAEVDISDIRTFFHHKLKHLRLSSPFHLSFENLTGLNILDQLTKLALTSAGNLKNISHVLPDRLTHLELGNCYDIDVDLVVALKKCTKIEHLCLKGGSNLTTQAVMSVLPKLIYLNKLQLINFDIRPGIDLQECVLLRRFYILPTPHMSELENVNMILEGTKNLHITHFMLGFVSSLLPKENYPVKLRLIQRALKGKLMERFPHLSILKVFHISEKEINDFIFEEPSF